MSQIYTTGSRSFSLSVTSHSILVHSLAKLNSQLDDRCSLVFPPSVMDVHSPSLCGPGHITIHIERKWLHVVKSTSECGLSDWIERLDVIPVEPPSRERVTQIGWYQV